MRVRNRGVGLVCMITLLVLLLIMPQAAFAPGNPPTFQNGYVGSITGRDGNGYVTGHSDVVSVVNNTYVPVRPTLRLYFAVNVISNTYWTNNMACIKLKDLSDSSYVPLTHERYIASSSQDVQKRSIFITPAADLVVGRSYRIEIDGGLTANNGTSLGTAGVIAKTVDFTVNTGGVCCTVTTKIISVTVDTSSYDYGVTGLNQSKQSAEITATNNGNITENFNIRGANATISGGTPWTLSTSGVGADQYMHKFGLPTYTTFTALSTDNQQMVTGVETATGASLGQRKFKLELWTPTSTSSQGQFSSMVTVQAVDPSP